MRFKPGDFVACNYKESTYYGVTGQILMAAGNRYLVRTDVESYSQAVRNTFAGEVKQLDMVFYSYELEDDTADVAL